MTEDIVLDDSELAAINGAVGATTVINIIQSVIDSCTPVSLIPPPCYSAWSFGPNFGGSYGFY